MIQNDDLWRQREGADAVPEVDLASTIRALRGGLLRQWRLIGLVTLLLTLLAVAYILSATPRYTARAALVIDPRISNSLSGPEAPTLLLSDALVVDSELKILSSREVTTRAAADLGLFDPPADAEQPAAPDANAQASRHEAIRREMTQNFEIRRDGGTYVIDIAYTSPDPVFAMQAVNTLIDAYFRVSSDASMSDTLRISNWLDQRVRVLADEVQAADLAVATYRRENALFTMRNGVLPSQAELSDAMDRLIALRSDLIETGTKKDKIKGIVATDSVAALMDGTLGGDVASPALRDFQTRYAGLIAEERDLVQRWGIASDTVARNREDQAQLRDLMLDEAAQIAVRLDTQQEAIRREITATEAQIEELRIRANSDAEKSIRLRELERDADAKRGQHDQMFQEMISATQRETFQRAPARVIARAVPPDQPSAPNARRLLILTVFGGLVLGCALAFLREVMDNRLRRISDLRDGLAVRYLGFLPGLPGADQADRPLTPQAQTALRGLIAELQQRKTAETALVTGIGSLDAGDGQGALTAALVKALAKGDDRVAVLNLDHRSGDLPAEIAQPFALGTDPVDDLARLRAVLVPGHPQNIRLPDDMDLLVPARQRELAGGLAAIRGDLDHVLIILPPLSGRAEADTGAALTDGVLLAVRWGDKTVPQASAALSASTSLRQKLFGAVFTAGSARGFRRFN